MSDTWYFAKGGQQQGPFTLEALRKLLAEGKVGLGDLVWNPTMTEWTAAQRVAELRSVLPVSPGAMPVAAMPGPFGQGGGELSLRVYQIMDGTRGWVRFMSISLLALGLLGLVAAVLLRGLKASSHGDTAEMIRSIAESILAYLVPAYLLSRYADRLRRLGQTSGTADLNDAIMAQKTFWKYVAILMVVSLSVMIVGLVYVIMVGVDQFMY